jgi:hypothetical protein
MLGMLFIQVGTWSKRCIAHALAVHAFERGNLRLLPLYRLCKSLFVSPLTSLHPTQNHVMHTTPITITVTGHLNCH